MRTASIIVALLCAFASASSCQPIESTPLSEAPMNECSAHPCGKYEPGTRAGVSCNEKGLCEVPAPGGRPDYAFWIVVHVPDTSIFAPGMTYVLYSDAAGQPAFKDSSTPGVISLCTPPQCLQIGNLSAVTGAYTVTNKASISVGYPLEEGASIPVRVVYEPTGNDQRPTFERTLPLGLLFASSRLLPITGVARYSRAVPFGQHLRVLYPQPPFDRYFPPTIDTLEILSANVIDTFVLGGGPPNGKPLDDVALDGTRSATISRKEGLDGWRVWLADSPSQRRISVLRDLSGTNATVRLDTTGENRAAGGAVGLGDDVEAVLAPPESWIAVPRFVTPLFHGAGLKNLSYPALPPPVSVTGVVAQPGEDGGTLLGYPARLSFESDLLVTRVDPDPLLKYSTILNTDDRGRFATILPPGNYWATIEPAEGTGYAKTRQPVVIDRIVTSLTLQPPPRTVVRGRVVLTDERPLSEADVVAIPDDPALPELAKPRPGRTVTGSDGRFAFELDPGPYVFTIIPKAGTGFPRVVTRPEVSARATELPEIRVPAPTRLSFTLRDPSPTGNPIVRAVVQILAAVPGREGAPIEIGSAMTDPEGLVEILLAQEPR